MLRDERYWMSSGMYQNVGCALGCAGVLDVIKDVQWSWQKPSKPSFVVPSDYSIQARK